MTKKIAKATLSFVMIFYFVFLSLFALGDYLYPDNLSLYQGAAPSGTLCFSYEEDFSSPLDVRSLSANFKTGKIYAFGVIPLKSVRVSYYENTKVVLGGDLFGVRINTNGLLVCGIDKILTEKGVISPGENAGVKKGDILLSCDGVTLDSAATFSKIIAKSEGRPMEILVKRGEEELSLSIQAVQASDKGGYRAGLWVRDGAAGIGTVTFKNPEENSFAGLGHAICDSETGVIFPLSSGSVCKAQVESITKGENGTPGEIRGKLEKETLGRVDANLASGVYGTLNEGKKEERLVDIGLKNNVKTG
ncbi:MAG: hypothetical protein IKU24_00145, partial [Clostridia bacterium]|nr:hypothetical protein [Clostridia bacterium]